MDTVAERLDKAVEIGGFKSRRQMCENLQISYNTLNTWIKNNKITKSAALMLSNSIDISKDYLLTGEGDPYAKRDLENLSEEELIALLPKDVQQLVRHYEKLPEEKKREHRQKLILEAAELEIKDE